MWELQQSQQQHYALVDRVTGFTLILSGVGVHRVTVKMSNLFAAGEVDLIKCN